MRAWGHVTALVAVLAAATVYGAPVEHWMTAANEFYEQGVYDSAAFYYEKVAESGVNNSVVYYNLGNAYFRLKQKGLAILYYEKAHRLNPTDPDIAANIKFANASIVDRLPQAEKGFVATVAWRLHSLFSLDTQLWALFFSLLLLSVLFSFGLFVSRNLRLWITYLSSLMIALVLLLGVSVGYKIFQAENTAYAVVLSESIDALSEPGGDKVLFPVHEGTKLRIRKEHEDWLLVGLPNGMSGWVEGSSLGRL